jgi:hypothetical protein
MPTTRQFEGESNDGNRLCHGPNVGVCLSLLQQRDERQQTHTTTSNPQEYPPETRHVL